MKKILSLGLSNYYGVVELHYDEDENKYVSKNIVKLDLYRKQVTTANGKVFHFVNEIGFDDYIEKPVTKDNLIPILEKIFNK